MNNLKELFRVHGGIMKTSELKEAGYYYKKLQSLVDAGQIERVRQGYYRYIGEDAHSDISTIVTLFPDGVLCRESALYYYGYLDKAPERWHLAIQSSVGKKQSDRSYPAVEFHCVREDQYALGITTGVMDGKKVKIYDRERVLLDLLLHQNQVEEEIFHTAVQRYFLDPEKKEERLICYAKVFHAEQAVTECANLFSGESAGKKDLAESIVFTIENRSLDPENQEEMIHRFLQDEVWKHHNFSDTKPFLEEFLLEVFHWLLSRRPYLEQYVPQAFFHVSEGDSEYMIQDMTERLMRLSRMLRYFEPSQHEKTARICRYIVENIDRKINLDILASRLFVNKKYLGTLLKANLGIKFTTYLRKIKVERAKKLLCDTDLTVYEISEMLHFKDVEYFSKVFKQETGSSPSSYTWFPNDDFAAEIPQSFTEKKEITIGVIGSYSGEYGYIEQGKKIIYQYAVEEINQQGGIDGRKIKLLYQDYESNLALVKEKTLDLINKGVDVVIGGFLSSAREIIRPILDKKKILYFYDSLYEGGLADHYTFCTSSMPEQNLLLVIQYLLQQNKKRFYILATDYNYGILSCECAKNFISELGGDLIATEYVPNHKTKFAVTIENILELDPDAIITFLVGEKQSMFFEQWHKTGNQTIPVVTTSAIPQGYMHLTTAKGTMENVYFSAAYSENLDTEPAKRWREKIRKEFSFDQIPYLGSDHEAAYLAVWLYKLAVEKCHSTDPEKVIHALEKGNLVLNMSGAYAEFNPRDHHLIRDIGIYRVDENNQIQTVYIIPKVKSNFVESVLHKTFHVKEGLKELGKKAPNVQYNMAFYRL